MAGYLNTPANSPGLFAGLEPDNQIKYQQINAARAFGDGIPKDANGQPDYMAMAERMYQKGDFANAGSLLQSGISMQQLRAAQAPSSVLGGGGGQPATPSSSSSSYTKPSPGFDSAVDRSLGFEGALNKSDTNGTPSNYGINQAAHPEVDVTKLTPDDAKAIYRKDYWDAVDGDNLPPPLSRAVFDTAVIAGPAKAKELLAQSGGDPMKLMTLREQFQQQLIQSDPAKYRPYQKAWNARNNGLRYDILALNAQGGQGGQTQGGQPQGGAPAMPAPIKVAQNGADDADPESAAPTSQHPYAPSKPAFQKPAANSPPQMPGAQLQMSGAQPQMPAMGAQPQPMLTPVGLNGPTQAGAPAAPPPPPPSPSPSPIAANSPPTRWASNGSTFADPTLGGLVDPEQLRTYGSYGNLAKAYMQEANSFAGNPAAKTKVDNDIWTAHEIMSRVGKAAELTNEQKNARDPSVLGYESQRDANKAQARVDAQNSAVAVQGAGARAEATEEGKTLGQVPAQLATAADSARSQNAMIDEMTAAASEFNMGKFADKEQGLNSAMSALGHRMGIDTSSIDGKVAAYEDFGKLAGAFSRQAMKETGGRAGGIQELKFVTNTLPSPTMSAAGFQAVGNQLKGMNDFSIAKQQAGEAWLSKNGSLKGFDADWNKNVGPSAFVMNRLRVDQPAVFSTTVQRLAQSTQGRAALQSMRSGLAWAGSNGLLQ